jgi:hypothetical protein
MPAQAVKDRLAEDVGLWQADGVISPKTADVLRQRYDVPGFGWGTLFRYLGLAGGLHVLLGLLGFVAALANSLVFGALLLGAVAVGFLYLGVRMARDPLARAPHAAKMVLALGVMSVGGACALIVSAAKASDAAQIVMLGLLVLPLTFGLAYRYSITFLLVLGLIGLFHWIGSWSTMLGRSTYALEVNDPRVMSVAAILAIAVGLFHERLPGSRWPRFHHAYESLGLLYLNLCLLILSITSSPAWMLLWTVLAIAQIVAGARLQNGLFTSFGVTAFAIDLFTRFHERFWDALDKGTFFVAAGLLLFATGVGLELLMRHVLLPPSAGAEPEGA